MLLLPPVSYTHLFNTMFKVYEEHAPLGRSCTGEELGATGVFLASDGAAAITGQVPLHLKCLFR